MRVGIFSGTFDPIHRGHIAFALEAIKQCHLDKVVLLPERSPRGKEGVGDFGHRLRMARLAVRPYAQLLTVALKDEQFTVQTTLPRLQKRYKSDQLVMLLGSDAVRTFSFRWPGLESLLASVELAVSLRAGETTTDMRLFLDSLCIPLRATIVAGSYAHVSATSVRKGELQGTSPIVRTYIERNGLYGQPLLA